MNKYFFNNMTILNRLVSYKNFLLLFLLLNTRLIFSQEYPDKNVHLLLTGGINCIIDQDYDKAENIFNNLNQAYPLLPLGKIYLAAVEIQKAFDYDTQPDNKKIESYLEEAVNQSKKLIEQNANDKWAIYFLALANGYKSYYNILFESWVAVFTSGFESESNFEKCLKIDDNFYDAYVAIGTYKYWKSRKTEFLNWLPIVKDERDLGVSYLLETIKHNSYSSVLARNSLIWIYIDKKEFSKAIDLANESLALYPKNRAFKLGLARAYEGINLEESIKTYYDIINSYSEQKMLTRYVEIVLKHKIAQNYYRLSNKDKTLQLCNEILAIKDLSSLEQDKLSGRLERVNKLKEWASK
jgi:hypothetical protein